MTADAADPGPPSQPIGHWRRFEFGAIVATIPAFYLALLETQRLVATILYAVACLSCLAVAYAEWRESARGDRSIAYWPRHQLGVLLAFACALSAVLPQGDQLDLVAVRLGTAVLCVLRAAESIRPWYWKEDLPRVIGLSLAVFALCGLGFWWLEPRVHSFGDGLWLAFITASTVGYGDLVPSAPASRIFAVFVVLLGFSLLSVVTASVAARWVRTEERKLEQALISDLHDELRLVRLAIAEWRDGGTTQPFPRPADGHACVRCMATLAPAGTGTSDDRNDRPEA